MTRVIVYEEYWQKLVGCFLGKAVGGTLGGPLEGQPGPFQLTFYDPVPTRMLPNDDLDLQVVWLEVIHKTGLPINRRSLIDGWLDHINVFPGEYGVSVRNMNRGLFAPVTGFYDNYFSDGMGAAIRSELWACLAPGYPDLAVAGEDDFGYAICTAANCGMDTSSRCPARHGSLLETARYSG